MFDDRVHMEAEHALECWPKIFTGVGPHHGEIQVALLAKYLLVTLQLKPTSIEAQDTFDIVRNMELSRREKEEQWWKQ